MKKIEGSPFGRFHRRRSDEPLLAPLQHRLAEGGDELSSLLQGNASGPASAFSGAVLLARRVAPRKSDTTRDYLLIFEHDGNRAGAAALLEAMASAEGGSVQSASASVAGLEYRRVKISREIVEDIRYRGDDDLAQPDIEAARPVPRAKRLLTTEEHHYIGPRLAVRSFADDGKPDPELIVQTLRRVADPDARLPSMADAANRRQALAILRPTPDVELYFDLERLIERRLPPSAPTLLGREADLEKLKLEELKSAAVGLRLLEDRLHLDFSLYAPNRRSGAPLLLFLHEPLDAARRLYAESEVLRALGPPAETPLTTADLIPPDAVGYSALGTNLPRLWREIRRLLAEVSPEIGLLVDAYFRSFGGKTRSDFETEVVGNLGRRWATFYRYPAGRNDRNEPEPAVLIEVRRAERLRPAFERWLAEIASLLNYDTEKTTEGNRTFYRLVGAETYEGVVIGMRPLAHICLTDDWLILSPSRDNINVALAHIERRRADAAAPPPFERIRAVMPPERFFEAAAEGPAAATLFDSLFLRAADELAAGVGRSVVEFDAASDRELWSEHFVGAGAAAEYAGRGLRAELFLLYREGAKGDPDDE